MTAYCPACHQPYADLAAVKVHIKKAVQEPEAIDHMTHVGVYEIEGWDETPVTPD